MNKMSLSSEKKSIVIISAVILVVILVLSFVFFQLKNKNEDADFKDESSGLTDTEEFLNEEELRDLEIENETIDILEGSEMTIEGGDLISKEGKVITIEGKEVKSDVRYDSEFAPRQSSSISEDELSEKVIKLKVGSGSFTPSTFNVKKGEAISLSLTGTDDNPHSLVFFDKALQAVHININAGETRVVSFNVPQESGDYGFRCGFPGHLTIGEEGIMTVK